MGKRCPHGKLTAATMDWLCDSGASICIGSQDLVGKLGMREDVLIPTGLKISSADSSNIRVLGMVLLEIEGGNQENCAASVRV